MSRKNKRTNEQTDKQTDRPTDLQTDRQIDRQTNKQKRFNPRLYHFFFVTRLTKGGVATPSLDFPNRTPYKIDFGIKG